MAVCPKPSRRGAPPSAGDWAHYLADDRESRERIVLMDGTGRDITAAEMIDLLGGPNATYWDGLCCPSTEECEALTEKFGGDHERAARVQGKLLAERLGRMHGTEPPIITIHWDSVDPPKWHYHITGKGMPQTFIYGEHGTIQRAWDIEWEASSENKIRNWGKHREYLALKKEGDLVRAELRQLGKDRFHALKNASPEDKPRIREEFNARERDLIQRRYELEVAAIDARYASREAVGSARHLAELKNAENRRTLSLGRIEKRELGRVAKEEVVERAQAMSAAKRSARSIAQAVSRESNSVAKAAEKGHRKTQDGRQAEAQQREAERAAAQLAKDTVGALTNVGKALLGREPLQLSGITDRPVASSLVSSLFQSVEAAAPGEAGELVRATGRAVQTVVQALAEGNLLRAAAAAAPEMPKTKEADQRVDLER